MDEFISYLYQAAPKNVIIGENDCNLLVFGDGSCIPTEVKMLLLVVGCTDPITEHTICELRKQYQNNATFKRLFDAGKKMAAIADIPFVMVGYKKCELEAVDEKYIDSMSFLSRKIYPEIEGEEPAVYTSDKFVPYLYSLMKMECSDEGTKKEKNKHLADVFHIWSRSKLSSRLVKQDFDAIYNNQDDFVMIEVKRSPAKTIEAWSPYRADGRNYDIQNQFAKMIHAAFFTFHHNGGDCNGSTRIGCYKILEVDMNQQENWIGYEKSILPAEKIKDLLEQKDKEEGLS